MKIEIVAKVTSLAALIRKHLNIETVITPGKTGQFEVIVDGKRIAERGGNWFTRSLEPAIPISIAWSSRSRSATARAS